mgnify:CR=1 FL=1
MLLVAVLEGGVAVLRILLGPVEHKRHSDVLLGRAQLEGV